MTDAAPPDLAKAERVLADKTATSQQLRAAADTFRRNMHHANARAASRERELDRFLTEATGRVRRLLNYLEQSQPKETP